jgi:PEGA domain-containing protein
MAKAEYAGARILYDDGDFAGALEKLRSAYDMSKDPRLLWNMAACQKNLRHYAEVVRLVDRYLSEGRGYVMDSDRSDATSLLDTVKDFISRVDVTSNEPGAAVFIDDVSVGTTPLGAALPVDMGSHKVRVSKAGFVDFATTVELPGGRPFSIAADLVVERHEGKLRVVAEPQDVLQIDGKVVGTGLWEGVLKSGTHAVYVTAKGKIAHQTEVVIGDNQVSSLNVSLEDRPVQTVGRSGVPAWVWIAGGVLVAGGGVGAYFLLKPHDAGYQSLNEGNWGAISL